jgi:hypothetical protein
VLSRYLQLRRRGEAPAKPVAEPVARSAGVSLVQAVAETAAVLGTALVIYLSLNAVTHPVTLRLQLTHLWPWPSEGTVRVIGLGICLAAVATSRYLRASGNRQTTTNRPNKDVSPIGELIPLSLKTPSPEPSVLVK